jgi:hypothetical protein
VVHRFLIISVLSCLHRHVWFDKPRRDKGNSILGEFTLLSQFVVREVRHSNQHSTQGFFTFNLAIYSYFGQAFMCLVSGMPTAQILASVFIGLNNFFSGLIVRPQFLTGFFEIPYWITPGHYVYEGLVLALFYDDNRTVVAVNNSEFYDFLECGESNINPCTGTIAEFIHVFFGGRFNEDNMLQNILVLALFLVTARVVTFMALRHFNYSDK